jgi:nucleoside-diphosphate-sugar epimerase
MAGKRIIITGGSGKAGTEVIRHFLASGYDVTNVDTRRPAVAQCPTLVADLTQLGQVVSAFSPHASADRNPAAGVVHFGAIPRPFCDPNDELFRTNTLSTHHVLEACGLLGIRKVVIASSESSYGHPFAQALRSPDFLPFDESHPQTPEDTYGLTKVINELTAAMFHRRDGTQVVSLRMAHVFGPEDYAEVAAGLDRADDRRKVLWSWIDMRDVASACRLALEKDDLGCVALNLCADQSTSRIPSAELARRFLPEVPLRRPLVGHEGLITNARAKTLLGWAPEYAAPPWSGVD